MEEREVAAVEKLDQLLLELEHLQNVIDLLAQGFACKREEQGVSSMHLLNNHIKMLRKKYIE